MIIRERKDEKERFPYGRLFLSMEAPGDEAPRRNMKTVTVQPNQRARLDFTNNLVVDDEPADTDDAIPDDIDLGDEADVGDDAPATPDNAPEDIDLPEPGQPQTPDTDVPADIELPEGDVEVDLEDIELPDEGEPNQTVTVGGESDNPADTEDFTASDTPGTDTATTADQPGTTEEEDNTDYTQGTAPDAPEIDPPPEDTTGDDNTDYTDVGGGDDTQDQGDTGTDNTTGDNNQGEQDGPGLEYDSVRQYNLFKEFMKLRTALDTYITKLEGCISDDPESNLIIKKATSKFRDVYTLVTDYMLMKFELCTYVQNLLFFEKQVATTTLIFKLLRTADELYVKQTDTPNNHRPKPKRKPSRREDQKKKVVRKRNGSK